MKWKKFTSIDDIPKDIGYLFLATNGVWYKGWRSMDSKGNEIIKVITEDGYKELMQDQVAYYKLITMPKGWYEEYHSKYHRTITVNHGST